MAKKISDNAKWAIGIILSAASLAFGSNLYDRFFAAREIAFDLDTPPPRSGVALLRIVNQSAKTCGPVEMEFTANAILKSAKIQKAHAGDQALVNHRSVQIDIARLAAGTGGVVAELQYEGLSSDVLRFVPVHAQVGCGERVHNIAEMQKQPASRVSSRWVVVAALAAVVVVAIVIGFFLLDPFRTLI